MQLDNEIDIELFSICPVRYMPAKLRISWYVDCLQGNERVNNELDSDRVCIRLREFPKVGLGLDMCDLYASTLTEPSLVLHRHISSVDPEFCVRV